MTGVQTCALPISALGVEGAAIATFISRFVVFLYMGVYMLKGKGMIKLKLKYFKYDFGYIKNILKVGVPSSLNQMIMSLGMILITKIVSTFGSLAIAAYGLAFRLDSVVLMPSFGIAIAVVTLVGHNVGAGKIERAKKITWSAAWIAAAIMAAGGLVMFLIPSLIVRVFTSDVTLISYTVSYLRIVGLTFGFIGFGMMIGSSFQGAGRGMPALVLTSLRVLIINVPLAYLLSLKYGLNGVWVSFAISTVVSAIVAIIWFNVTRFKNEDVH